MAHIRPVFSPQRVLLTCALWLWLALHTRAVRPPFINRGVNLGGFLVLEPSVQTQRASYRWITPSMFEVELSGNQIQPVDEWTLSEYHGSNIDTIMAAHYESWVSSQDLQLLASAGVNALRLGVGYWIISRNESEPFVSPDVAWPYLTRVLDWSRTLGLHVQIEIHGMPGSQNGLDHSGRRGPILWPDSPNYERGLDVLRNLTQKLQDEGYLAPDGPVTMIQPVNEPWLTLPLDFLRTFYETAYGIIRSIAPQVAVVVSDSFRISDPSFHVQGGFMPSWNYTNVYLDEHFYQIFDDPGLTLTPQGHIDSMYGFFQSVVADASSQMWVNTGEFSLATTDCAKWLNGVGLGARWDGTQYDPTPVPPIFGNCTGDDGNDYTQFSDSYKQYLRTSSIAQFATYQNALGTSDSGSAGFFFWTMKTEQAPQWNFLLGLQQGWIPYPVTAQGNYSGPVALPTFAPLPTSSTGTMGNSADQTSGGVAIQPAVAFTTVIIAYLLSQLS